MYQNCVVGTDCMNYKRVVNVLWSGVNSLFVILRIAADHVFMNRIFTVQLIPFGELQQMGSNKTMVKYPVTLSLQLLLALSFESTRLAVASSTFNAPKVRAVGLCCVN